MADYTIHTVVFCDDVRREATNKDTILGVFGGDIILQKVPALIFLAFWIELSVKKAGPHIIDVKVEFPVETGDGSAEGDNLEITFLTTTPTAFVLPRIPFPIGREGEIKVRLRVDKGKWRIARTKRIRVGEVVPGRDTSPST